MASNNKNGRSSEQGNQNGKRSGTSNRGFASMDPERVSEIAAKGGRAAHEAGTAHEFDTDEAREAGRRGGQSRAGRNGQDNSNDQ